MKQFAASLFLALLLASCASQPIGSPSQPALVEASCGQCNFGLTGQGCDLAVRVDGKAYYVDGTGIDDHGDAHAEDGFCEAVRKAKVVGEVKGGRFKAERFELVGE